MEENAVKTFTLNGLAEELGLPRTRLAPLMKDVSPIENNGNVERWTLRQAVKALGFVVPPGRPKAERTESDKDFQETRFKRLQADRAEIKLERDKGKMIPIETALSLFGDILMAFRAKMLQMPSRMAGRLVNVKGRIAIEAKLETEIQGALSEFSRFNPDDFLSKLQGDAEGVGGNVSGVGSTTKTDG